MSPPWLLQRVAINALDFKNNIPFIFDKIPLGFELMVAEYVLGYQAIWIQDRAWELL